METTAPLSVWATHAASSATKTPVGRPGTEIDCVAIDLACTASPSVLSSSEEPPPLNARISPAIANAATAAAAT